MRGSVDDDTDIFLFPALPADGDSDLALALSLGAGLFFPFEAAFFAALFPVRADSRTSQLTSSRLAARLSRSTRSELLRTDASPT